MRLVAALATPWGRHELVTCCGVTRGVPATQGRIRCRRCGRAAPLATLRAAARVARAADPPAVPPPCAAWD